MKAHFIQISQNAKTGPIPVSIIERASCWPGCALYENGCYAETGALAMHWDRVSRGPAGGSWSEFCAKVAALRPGRQDTLDLGVGTLARGLPRPGEQSVP
jgi:hypothetical protein